VFVTFIWTFKNSACAVGDRYPPGPFQGIEATGRRVTFSEFTLYRVEDGKFAGVWDLTYMDAVTRQIGQGEASNNVGSARTGIEPPIAGV
jgi:hypothetical protein